MAAYTASPSTDSPGTSPGTSPNTILATSTPNDGDTLMGEAKPQDSPFLSLPVDIFKCITDYLDRDAACALKRLCRGMSRSKFINELLYKYPIQTDDVSDLNLLEWKYRPKGQHRWQSFQESINDINRHYVQKLAVSHWASLEDFKWIEANLCNLKSLDLSSIKDFVWTPEETWSWKQLADTCPVLFERLEELEVCNWTDYTAHSRIEISYSFNDYRYRSKFRISRRRDGGSVATIIFPLCKNLKALSIREKYTAMHSWDEWMVHQRVCSLVNGIEKYCSPTLTKLRVHDYGPYRSLLCTGVTKWERIRDVEIHLYEWLDKRRGDGELFTPIPSRITPGNHHREEEDVFDDKSFDTCEHDHLGLGQQILSGVNASFADVLKGLYTITQKYPNVNITPIGLHRNTTYQPLSLISAARPRFGRTMTAQPQPRQDTIFSPEAQDALDWLVKKCEWQPVLAWDNMMSDVFPENLDLRFFLPKADLLTKMQAMIETFKSHKMPIRISFGERGHSCYTSPDGCLYFGDSKSLEGEGDDKREVLSPTQARCNLAGIAGLVDELTIQYPYDVPGVAGWNFARQTMGIEKALMDREKMGWRRFWARYAPLLKNLKKLSLNIPYDIYNDWAQSADFRRLLDDERWDVLDVDHPFVSSISVPSGFLSFRSLKYSTTKQRPRMKFAQRVFFRLDDEELQLGTSTLTSEEVEAMEISDQDITSATKLPQHRFWPAASSKADKSSKRKADDGVQQASVKRTRLEDLISVLAE